MDHLTLDRLLRQAIAERRLISFTLAGRARIGEPHDYGIYRGQLRLFFYQTGGESQSGKPLGWRWANLEQISRLETLGQTFAGARATAGAHIAWDELHASVARRNHDSR